MTKFLCTAASIIILFSFNGCKSYVKKKWDDKQDRADKQKVIDNEAKGTHVWFNDRMTKDKYHKFATRNVGNPNY